MRILSGFASIIDRISEWIGKSFSWLVYVMMLVVAYEVTSRYVFNSPTRWGHETSGFILAIIVLMGMAYAHRLRSHVNVDIIVARFSPRGKAILDLVVWPIFLLFCAIMLWKTWDYSMLSLSRLQHSDTFWAPPLYPFKLLMPLGFSLIILQGISNLIRDINIIRTGKE